MIIIMGGMVVSGKAVAGCESVIFHVEHNGPLSARCGCIDEVWDNQQMASS